MHKLTYFVLVLSHQQLSDSDDVERFNDRRSAVEMLPSPAVYLPLRNMETKALPPVVVRILTHMLT